MADNEFKQFEPIPIEQAQNQGSIVPTSGGSMVKDGSLFSSDYVEGQKGWRLPSLGGPEFQLSDLQSLLPVCANSTTSRDMTAASGNQTIAHGLGTTPRWVKITAIHNATAVSNTRISVGKYNGTTTSSVFNSNNSTDAYANTDMIYIETAAGAKQVASITVDATNITLAWVKTGAPTGTAYLMWEAGLI